MVSFGPTVPQATKIVNRILIDKPLLKAEVKPTWSPRAGKTIEKMNLICSKKGQGLAVNLNDLEHEVTDGDKQIPNKKNTRFDQVQPAPKIAPPQHSLP